MYSQPIIHRYAARIVLCLMPVFAAAANGAAQIVFPSNLELTFETSDGMLIAGTVASASGATANVKTPYGELLIPFENIQKINGAAFDPERGIIVRHTATIEPDGDVVVKYLTPIPSRKLSEHLTLLVPGQVISIETPDGDSLPFQSRAVGSLSRCQIQLPSRRLAAVVMTVRKPAAAVVSGNSIQYAYRITPQLHQTFEFAVTAPAGYELSEAAPAAIAHSTETIYFSQQIERQQDLEIRLTLRVKQ